MSWRVTMWAVLCRSDRLADGLPGPYVRAGFGGDFDGAVAYAETVARSRHPLVVRERAVPYVLAVLNAASK